MGRQLVRPDAILPTALIAAVDQYFNGERPHCKKATVRPSGDMAHLKEVWRGLVGGELVYSTRS